MVSKSNTVRYTAAEIDEMLRRGEDKTDWARVDAMTEEELEASIDPEDEGVGEPDWSTAQIELPRPKQSFTMRYDPEVLEWFRAQGPGYQSKMNAVLKKYVEVHSKRS
jgi:uncharacterized protein (DUF4415 family)